MRLLLDTVVVPIIKTALFTFSHECCSSVPHCYGHTYIAPVNAGLFLSVRLIKEQHCTPGSCHSCQLQCPVGTWSQTFWTFLYGQSFRGSSPSRLFRLWFWEVGETAVLIHLSHLEISYPVWGLQPSIFQSNPYFSNLQATTANFSPCPQPVPAHPHPAHANPAPCQSRVRGSLGFSWGSPQSSVGWGQPVSLIDSWASRL